MQSVTLKSFTSAALVVASLCTQSPLTKANEGPLPAQSVCENETTSGGALRHKYNLDVQVQDWFDHGNLNDIPCLMELLKDSLNSRFTISAFTAALKEAVATNQYALTTNILYQNIERDKFNEISGAAKEALIDNLIHPNDINPLIVRALIMEIRRQPEGLNDALFKILNSDSLLQTLNTDELNDVSLDPNISNIKLLIEYGADLGRAEKRAMDQILEDRTYSIESLLENMEEHDPTMIDGHEKDMQSNNLEWNIEDMALTHYREKKLNRIVEKIQSALAPTLKTAPSGAEF